MPCSPLGKSYFSSQNIICVRKLFFLTLLSGICLQGCKQKIENPADAIYFHGDIITMEGNAPVYAETVAIKKGRIVFVGSEAEARKMEGDSTVRVDLEGRTLLPGFIDAHGHLTNAGFQASVANLLPPPDGTGVSIASLVNIMKEWDNANKPFIEKVGWVIGFGYDDGQLEEHAHPTADDLDKVSTTLPVIMIHQSGHLGVMNSKALQTMGYGNDVADPIGGVIRRKTGTRVPNGVVEEMGLFIALYGILKNMDEELGTQMVLAGINAYTQFGFTTAQEGRASALQCEVLKNVASKGLLAIDVVAYPDIQNEMDYMKVNREKFNYLKNFRFGGVKLSLDGSPQGKTAWLTQPYKVPPPGKNKSYRGYPAIPDEKQVLALVDSAFANNWQILAHCNGDAAIDQYIRAIRHATIRYGNEDRRAVMVHAQTIREDQLDSIQNLFIIPSFFGMHTFYWGDWHRDETLGLERAYRISPGMSALNRGIVFTQHHDAPVAKPDAMRILWSVVNRVSRSGDIIGPNQRIPVYQALISITRSAAYQYFEERLKGTLTVGKLADFVVLSDNPLKADPMTIDKIRVMRTIKEGRIVYSALE